MNVILIVQSKITRELSYSSSVPVSPLLGVSGAETGGDLRQPQPGRGQAGGQDLRQSPAAAAAAAAAAAGSSGV